MSEKTDGISNKIYYELRFESKRITEGSAADRWPHMVPADRKIAASAMIYCDESGDPPIDEEEVFESLQEKIEEQIREKGSRKRNENVIKLYKLRFEEYEINEGGDEKLIRGDVAEKHVLEHGHDMNTDQDVYDELEQAVRKARFPFS